MKKRNLMITMMCACLMAANILPVAVTAEESTEAETEIEEESSETGEEEEAASEEEEDTEAASETGEDAEAVSEAEEETEEEIPERPSYDALEYVELGGYIGLNVEVPPVNVTEAEVMTEAEALIRNSDAMEQAETVQDGDIVTIDYVGTIDGEEFDGGSSEDYELEIGSGTFIEGFEEGLIGADLGETVELNLTFPEYYYDELAGQDAVFTVTVNDIRRLPELTDEVVDTATNGVYTDVDSWLSYIRSALEAQAQVYWEYDAQEAVLEALVANSVITGYPEDLIEYMVDPVIEYYQEIAELYYGMTYEEYLSAVSDYTPETFEEELHREAEESLDYEMPVMAVAEAEGMTLSDEEYQASLEQLAAGYGYDDPQEFETDYEAANGKNILYESILFYKALDFVEDNAIITDAPVETEEESESAAEEPEEEPESAAEEPEEEPESAADELGEEPETEADEPETEAGDAEEGTETADEEESETE